MMANCGASNADRQLNVARYRLVHHGCFTKR
jgi:hypothetical protein